MQVATHSPVLLKLISHLAQKGTHSILPGIALDQKYTKVGPPALYTVST